MNYRSLTKGVLLLVVSTALALCPAPGRAQDQPPAATAQVPGILLWAEKEYAMAQNDRHQMADQLAKLRSEIANATGQVEVSADGIRHAIEKLQEQQEQLQLDAAGADGRRQGLERAIKEYTATAADRAASDEAVKQLEKVAAVRAQQLERVQQLYKAGAVQSNEVATAEAAVAQAQADVALAKQRAAGGPGPNSALDTWNREAMNLSVEESERRARLKYIQSRLDQYQQVIGHVGELEQLTADLRAAEARREAARLNMERIRAQVPTTNGAAPSGPTESPHP
jgi:chromosome segregation ATPase